jgi:hypothetical protein
MPIRIMSNQSRIYIDALDRVTAKAATGSAQASICLGEDTQVFITSGQGRMLRDQLLAIFPTGGSDGQ